MIDEKTMDNIAKLARLSLSEEETRSYAQDLSKILEAFKQLETIDTKGVEPLITPTEIEYILREDEVHQKYSSDEMLALAPERVGNLFKVPPVV